MNDLSLEEALYERLDPVVRRDTTLRRLRAAALVLIGAVAVALILTVLEERTGWGGQASWAVLVLGTLVALLLGQHSILQRAPDLRAMARLVEQARPDLRALLLTAVGEATGVDQGRFGYLQEQVIREAVDRAAAGAWPEAVPRRRLMVMGAATAAAALMFVGLAAAGIFPGLAALIPDQYGLAVTPGHTEVERGSAVTVLARFDRQVPTRATLIVRPRGRAPVRVDMTRSLADPLFSASTPPLDGRTDYQIEYAGHRSRRYRVETFVVPQVDRLDARVVYPAQVGLAAHDVLDARRLSVTEGARVTVTVHFTLPVNQADLVSEDGVTLHLGPGDRPEVRVITFDPDRTRHYEIQLVDPRWRRHRASAGLTVDVRGNEPAQIALSFPGRDVRVSPLEEVTLEARVSDDVALMSYGVSYALGGKPEREVRLGGGQGERSATAQLLVPLETLTATPGDLLVYHFWAEDVAADGNRRRVSSDMYFAEVRPFEESFREGPSGGGPEGGEGGPADQLARRQKEVINATWRLEREARDGTTARGLESDVGVVSKGQGEVKKSAEGMRLEPLPREEVAALDQALDAMTKALAQLDDALGGSPAAGLEAARGSEQTAYAALLRMRPRVHQVGRGKSGTAAGSAEESDRALDDLDLKQQQSRYETRSEAAAQDQGTRENRQVLSRLRELAERQKALTERLKDLKLALTQRPKERDELEERLKRLRDEQQELVGDLDELMARLDRPENRSRLAEARNALEETRARAGEASQALAEGDPGRALGAGTRAERALDKVREDLQRRVARGFGEEMRGLRDEARKLAEEQARLGEGLAKGPSGPTESRRLAEMARRQKAAASALLEKMSRLTEESEPTAPLLSRKLYESIRQAKSDGVEQGLDRVGELLEQNLAPQAGLEEARARQAIVALDQGVGAAAKGVLGDQGEALRLARGELDALVDQAGREGLGAGGEGGDRPITGEGFAAFADRLRDVGELLDDPRGRAQAARVLEQARALRSAFRRHGERPRWDLFEAEVVKPLGELRDLVGEELRRVTPDRERLAPIDRDPVPSRFTDLVRRYYKSLAGE